MDKPDQLSRIRQKQITTRTGAKEYSSSNKKDHTKSGNSQYFNSCSVRIFSDLATLYMQIWRYCGRHTSSCFKEKELQ